MLKIGQYTIDNQVILAPMAGVTDLPFRKLCRRLGAGMVVSEMVSANPNCRNSRKSRQRATHEDEVHPRIIQIAGGDPDWLADAARYNADQGAEIIDINMGCPAKKVCNKAAGSALLKDERLVQEILEKTVNAVSIPVTLKIRTGWDRANKNGINVAKIAENAGIQALAIHGRTRADRFQGEAEYETIAQIKQAINIPVIANGDINTPEQAKNVLDKTQADAVMIGRAAQGYPWIFREIDHYLQTGNTLKPATRTEIAHALLDHLKQLYDFYGEYLGPRIARKHVGWYLKTQPDSREFRREFNVIESPDLQLSSVKSYFDQ